MKKINLLILEDNTSDAELVLNVLKRNGINFDAAHASTKKEFVTAIENNIFDIILSDNNMLQFDATTALQLLHERKIDTPVILVTGTVSEEFAVDMIKKGVSDYILKDRLHRLPTAIATAVDLQERNKQKTLADEKLKHSEKRMKQAQAMAHLGNWELDFETGYTVWSEEQCRIYGVSPEDNIQPYDVWLSFIHPDDVEYVKSMTNGASETLQTTGFFHRIIRRDGTLRYLYSEAQFEFSANGKPTGVYGIAHDISEVTEQQEEIRKNNERFVLLNKAVREAIIDWDIVNDKTTWGDGFTEIFGYQREQYHNHLWSDNIHPDDRNKVLSELEKKLSDPADNVFVIEFRFIKENGETAFVEHRGIFIRDEKGRAIRAIGALKDITRLVRKSEAIQKQNTALRDIAWIQSHVIRSPLATLMGLVEVVKLDEGYDAHIFNGIQIAAQNLDKVIHEIVKKAEEVEYSFNKE